LESSRKSTNVVIIRFSPHLVSQIGVAQG